MLSATDPTSVSRCDVISTASGPRGSVATASSITGRAVALKSCSSGQGRLSMKRPLAFAAESRELARESARVVVDALAGESFGAWIPGEVDDDVDLDGTSGRGLTLPRSALRAAHGRDLDDALRTDHDVLEVEPHVRKRAEEAHIERARAGVAFPALAGGDDLVHAVLGQRGDETGKVASILGLRVIDPETPDLRVELWCDVPPEA